MLFWLHQVWISIPAGRLRHSRICSAHWRSRVCCAMMLVCVVITFTPDYSEYKKLRLNFLYCCNIYDYYCKSAWQSEGTWNLPFTDENYFIKTNCSIKNIPIFSSGNAMIFRKTLLIQEIRLVKKIILSTMLYCW